MINYTNTPCLGCKERHVGCHGTCEKYKIVQEYSRKVKASREHCKIYEGNYENDTKRRTHEKIKARNLK